MRLGLVVLLQLIVFFLLTDCYSTAIFAGDDLQCTGKTDNTSSASAKCHLGNNCKGYWTIAVVVMTNRLSAYQQFVAEVDNVSISCTSGNKAYFLSPSKLDANLDCSIDTYTKSYFANQAKTYHMLDNENHTGDELAVLLDKSSNCLKKNPLTGGNAGIAYVLTDVNCSSLCSSSLTSSQMTFISTLVSQGYYIRIVDQGDTACIHSLFKECSLFNDLCKIDVSATFESICHSHELTTVDLAILIAVGIAMLILLIILFFYIRWRNKKKLRERVKQRARSNHQNSQTIEKERDPWELMENELEILIDKQLGSGAFAVVYEGKLKGRRPVDEIIPTAQLMSNRSERVAVKRVPPYVDIVARRDFLDEVHFMKKLGFHTHVLGMIGCMTAVELPLIVLEFCENGDLLGFLKKYKDDFGIEGTLRLKDLLSISWQISDGLCYLKSLDLIHRDLAARNILLTKDLTAKISDFGLCRQPVTTDSSTIYISRGGRLPVKWMAPESLRNFHFSFQTDLWSFGIVLWETFSLGDMPYAKVNPTAMLETLQDGERLEKPEVAPDPIFELMTACWKMEPEERGTIEEVRNKLSESLSMNSIYYGYLSFSEEEMTTIIQL